jgi:hypothetical protein
VTGEAERLGATPAQIALGWALGLAEAYHHETGEQKEHNIDQWDDLDPRVFVSDG